MRKDITKLAKQLRKELQENILNRYDKGEYWEIQVADDFYADNQLNDSEIQKIIESLGL
jgi:hypothetical protein